MNNIQYGYNDKRRCPLTPAEKRLKVAVRAAGCNLARGSQRPLLYQEAKYLIRRQPPQGVSPLLCR